MEYKGYNAVVTYDNDLGILHGEVIDTRDVITFQARSVDDLEVEFQRSVDDYLKFCEERGREPDKPFSGKVALRMDPETHRSIVGVARTSGKSLNTWILDAIGNEMHRADAGADDFAWAIEETAMEAFQVFLQEVSQHRRNQEPVSHVIPMWFDLSDGSIWASDTRPPHEVFCFGDPAPEGASKEWNWIQSKAQ